MATRRFGALFALAATAALACDPDGGVTLAPTAPLAYTRFVNAVADTGPTDWRFIDQIENSPVAFGLTFRAFTPYQATAPGQRRLRVFPTSSDIAITSKFLIDTTLTLAADTYYTIVHVGYADAARSPRHRILLLADNFVVPAAGAIAIRAVHLGTALGNVDVFASAAGGATPLPATPLFGANTFAGASPYQPVATGPLDLRVTPQGQVSPFLADVLAPAGVAGDAAQGLTTIGGSLMEKSVISALFMPRSVAGTSAPQTAAFTSSTLVYLIDRHPR